MWKFLLIIISLLFVFTENVFSLFCYISDFETFKSGNVKNLNFSLQDCQHYNDQIRDLSRELCIGNERNLECYTVEVSRDVYIKGCSYKNSCGFLLDFFQNFVQSVEDLGQGRRKVSCTECSFNGCNEGVYGFWETEDAPLAPLIESRSNTSLKCYHCLEKCEVSEAEEKICGSSIGPNHEAICSVEVERGSPTSDVGVRKCRVIQKDQKPFCPENSVCSFCKSDLCNIDLETTGK